MRADFGALFMAAAGLVGTPAVSDEEAGLAFVALMKALVQLDHAVVFAYRGAERPIHLFSTFDAEQYDVFVGMYQEGPYLLDPFFSAAAVGKPGVWRMRELAPDRFYASEYYRGYYVKTGLAEEVGFFVPTGEGVTVVLSLMRSEMLGTFRDAEFRLLASAEPLVQAMVRHAWGGLASRFDRARSGSGRRSGGKGSVRNAISDKLTRRETAIIELVLQGHSSESVGLRLGIATGTVKVHRRNIYRKLGISSQAQLMSLYLGEWKTSG